MFNFRSLKNRQTSKKLVVIGNQEKYILCRTCSDGENEFIIMLIFIFRVFAFIGYIRA